MVVGAVVMSPNTGTMMFDSPYAAAASKANLFASCLRDTDTPAFAATLCEFPDVAVVPS